MKTVIGVEFRPGGKTYFFDPQEWEFSPGDGVIVDTARGQEYGAVKIKNMDIRDEEVVKPLRKVVRPATESDNRRHEANEARRGEMMRICREKIAEHELDMKLVDVSFTYDSNKIVYYFTADGRIDFRDLVRDLANELHARIELRQIGVRDEAKRIGGIGCCGRPLCCASWLKNFQPVSIKMTKMQNLSLNPTKISGICGRLMCCLKYENDVYMELRKDLPSVNERVRTEEGIGKVIESNVLAGTIKVRMFTGEKDEKGRDKLDSEVYTFQKGDVERLGKGKNGGRPGKEKPSGEDEKPHEDGKPHEMGKPRGEGKPRRARKPHGEKKPRRAKKPDGEENPDGGRMPEEPKETEARVSES